MHTMSLWEMILKLVISLVLGGLIGLEREAHGRPAGLRTHVLVCLGSTLYALCSYTIAGTNNDPGRITAQIVTGIGFLGAGTILRQGSIVRGLTTAASIWTVAAIGIAVAVGGSTLYLAIVASVLVFCVLNFVPSVERHFMLRRGERLLTITAPNTEEAISRILALLAKAGGMLRVFGTEETDCDTQQVLKVRIHVGRYFDDSALSNELATSKDVINYSWE